MSHRSPLRTVWFNPSRTIAGIAHENPGYRLFALPIIAGAAVWPTIALFSMDKTVEYGLILSTLLTFGPVVEVLQLFVGAYLIRLTGIWLGGKAGIESIQTAIAWGNVPIVALAILSIFLLMFSGFYAAFSGGVLAIDQSLAATIIGFFFLALQFIFVAWSIGIYLQGLAAVQGYSTGRAIVNSILAWAVPAVVIIIVVTLFGYSDKLPWMFLAGFEELVFLDE